MMYGHIPVVGGIIPFMFPDVAKGYAMTADSQVLNSETFQAGNNALLGGGGGYSGSSFKVYDGTPTTSSYGGDNAGAGVAPQTWVLTMGIARAFRSLTIYAVDDAVNLYHPWDFSIESSADGSAWTSLVSYTSQNGWSIGVGRLYAIPANGGNRYWRLNCTAGGYNNAFNTFGLPLNQLIWNTTP